MATSDDEPMHLYEVFQNCFNKIANKQQVTEKAGYQSPYGGMDNGMYGVAATSCAASNGHHQPDRRHHHHHQHQHADVPPQWDLTTEESQNISAGEYSFQWSSEAFEIKNEPFDDFFSGISPSMMSSVSSELDIFLHYCNEAYVEKIVEFTNSYQQYVVRHIDIKLHSRLKNWYPVTVPEMYTFFAVCMLMTRNSRNTIEEHWSTNPYLHSGIYGSLMSRNRFCTILGMLHFCQPGPRTEEETILSKIIYPVNHARHTFKNSFIPYEKICIDESIVPFKGRLLIKQYLPKKRNRFGIKLFVLCDVLSGIILDFIVYCGKDTELTHFDNLGVSGSVVATLLEDYYGVNRKLYIDNWYSSPKLSIFLKQRSIHTCGTVKPNRSEMPKFKNLKKGEREALYSDPIMAMKWRDKKNIHMLTTIHKDEMGPTKKMDPMTGLPKLKPECIIDYNKNMGAVDISDMMLSGLQCIRKTIKWYKKLFFHILDLHLLNSYHIYKITCNDDFSPSFRKIPIGINRTTCSEIW